MKKSFSKVFALLLGVVVTLTSCNNTEDVVNLEEQCSVGTVPVHIQVTNFSMSVDDIPESPTRATDSPNPAENDNVKQLTLAFYSGSTEVTKITQVKDDDTTYETFGEFNCNLPAGSYTMVVIGCGAGTNDAFSLSSPTQASYNSEYVRETFCATQSVTVTTTETLDLSVTLNRIVTLLAILSTDTRPADAAKIRITSSAGSKAFNPTTGLATGNPGFTVVLTLNSSVGQKIGVGAYAFLAADEQTMDITLEVLDDGDNILFRKSIPNVPFKRNRRTTLSGALFSPSATTATITLETTWLDPITITY
jgi:hypothetical protein